MDDVRRAGRVVMLTAALLAATVPRAAAQDAELALAVAREIERIAADRTLWPGFEPLSVPLAIYTGKDTYLIRHPSPPEGFTPLAGAESKITVYEGRHPAMVANTSMEIGGVMTATLLLGPGAAERFELRELAALAIHEAFHVFQRERHPGWVGNEADMLLYPVDDAGLLTLRRRESAALRRALEAANAADDGAVACWTGLALEARRERFDAMDTAFSTYERLTELNEGLAAYLQLRAAEQGTVELPETDFPPAAVRNRSYTVGAAISLLLDRFRPGWPESLEENDAQHLDTLLRGALEARQGPTDACAFRAEESEEIERAAREDAAALIARRTERRQTFDANEGWRVVVEAASGRPLWPQGFDPINVEHVDGGLLHTRFLRLGNETGELTAMDGADAHIEALTEAAGAHPLFTGVARVTIAGIAERPMVDDDGERTVLRAPGFSASFLDAEVEVRDGVVVVRLR